MSLWSWVTSFFSINSLTKATLLSLSISLLLAFSLLSLNSIHESTRAAHQECSNVRDFLIPSVIKELQLRENVGMGADLFTPRQREQLMFFKTLKQSRFYKENLKSCSFNHPKEGLNDNQKQKTVQIGKSDELVTNNHNNPLLTLKLTRDQLAEWLSESGEEGKFGSIPEQINELFNLGVQHNYVHCDWDLFYMAQIHAALSSLYGYATEQNVCMKKSQRGGCVGGWCGCVRDPSGCESGIVILNGPIGPLGWPERQTGLMATCAEVEKDGQVIKECRNRNGMIELWESSSGDAAELLGIDEKKKRKIKTCWVIGRGLCTGNMLEWQKKHNSD